MATRDLTSHYNILRSRKGDLYSDHGDSDDEFGYINSLNRENEEISIEMNDNQWNQVLDATNEDMNLIKIRMNKLSDLHKSHSTFKVKKKAFSDDQEEQKIEILTTEIKNLFKKCKTNINSLDVKTELENQEDLIKKNIKLSLITGLTSLSSEFSKGQQNYLRELKKLKGKKKEYNTLDNEDMEPEEKAQMEKIEDKIMYDPSFTEEQVQDMIENEKDIVRRDKELREILKSIVELHELMQEFSSMVIEQGSMLDRIDANLEKTHYSVKKANKDLVTAEKYQKVSRLTLCILLLVIVLVGVALLVALRLLMKFNVIPIPI